MALGSILRLAVPKLRLLNSLVIKGPPVAAAGVLKTLLGAGLSLSGSVVAGGHAPQINCAGGEQRWLAASAPVAAPVAVPGEAGAAGASTARLLPDYSDSNDDDDDDDDDDDGDEEQFQTTIPDGLRVNTVVEHDLLGPGCILELAEMGTCEDWQQGKVLFEFTPRTGTKAKGKCTKARRWVFADACTPLPPTVPENGESPEVEPPSAFTEMLNAATGENAFTSGMEPIELAAHERERKRKRLATAKPGGYGRGPALVRKTVEPNVPVAQRIAEFPGQYFVEACRKLFCEACKKEISLRKVSVTAHSNTQFHKADVILFAARNQNDDHLRNVLITHFTKDEDQLLRSLPLDVHLFRFRTVQVTSPRFVL